MASAPAAMHGGPDQAEGGVAGGADRLLQGGPETRPAGAAVELRGRGECIKAAPGAGEEIPPLLVQQRAGERPLGRGLAQHGVLDRGQQMAPFGVGMGDLEHLVGVRGAYPPRRGRGRHQACRAGCDEKTSCRHNADPRTDVDVSPGRRMRALWRYGNHAHHVYIVASRVPRRPRLPQPFLLNDATASYPSWPCRRDTNVWRCRELAAIDDQVLLADRPPVEPVWRHARGVHPTIFPFGYNDFPVQATPSLRRERLAHAGPTFRHCPPPRRFRGSGPAGAHPECRRLEPVLLRRADRGPRRSVDRASGPTDWRNGMSAMPSSCPWWAYPFPN
jgi:hypothetical protein